MLPLIRMTWAINRRLLLGFSPVLAFYLSMLVYAQCQPQGHDAISFPTLFTGITGLLTLVVTFQGLTLEVEGFLLALPVTRANVVRAKYLTSLLGLASGVALPLTVAWVAHVLVPGRVPPPPHEALHTVALVTLLLASGIFLFLPFIHHFGPAKGFLAFALTALLVPSAGLAWKGLDGAAAAQNFFSRSLGQPSLALAFCGGVLVFGFASLRLSTWSFSRRAF